jgi:hypothetical protein
MAQTIKKTVERPPRAYEVVLSDFEDSWHVMVIRLPDALGSEARGLTIFEGLFESQDAASEAADQFLDRQGDR